MLGEPWQFTCVGESHGSWVCSNSPAPTEAWATQSSRMCPIQKLLWPNVDRFPNPSTPQDWSIHEINDPGTKRTGKVLGLIALRPRKCQYDHCILKLAMLSQARELLKLEHVMTLLKAPQVRKSKDIRFIGSWMPDNSKVVYVSCPLRPDKQHKQQEQQFETLLHWSPVPTPTPCHNGTAQSRRLPRPCAPAPW